MKTQLIGAVVVVGTWLAANVACAAEVKETPCEPIGSLQFVCGPKNAEDLVLVPGTKWIIASSLAAGNGLYLIDSRDGTWSAAPLQTRHDAAFADCETPPSASTWVTHGLNLRARTGGHSKLYVVGHGAREAIEIFDVDANTGKPTLTWEGCVPLPAGLAANSVASLADGSLVATVPLLNGKTFPDSMAREPTGAVFRWSAGAHGFEVIPGTELAYNNGIEVSADGKEIYVASSGYQTVVAFSNSNPAVQLRSTGPLSFTPDNVHMGSDGKLLTAGMKNDEPACGGAPKPHDDLDKFAGCPRGTIAIAIDPATMKDTVVVDTPATSDFSNATMVLIVGKQFWLGTFVSDRVAYGTLR